jgi:arginine decarboxylase
METTTSFDIAEARELYNIDRWSGDYFGINEAGHVCVYPKRNGETIDLMDVVAEARSRKLAFPLVVRFHDLLRDRVETINKAFSTAISESGYNSPYRGVFPIKVNQLREVVEEIIDAGKPWHFGIEAGSKPELLAALAVHSDPESLVICNGYKDTSFIQNALLGRKLGKTVILVVEKLEELAHILRVSQTMKIEPFIGLRVRLLSKGAGKWATSGGENAKFGLSTADLVEASDMLHAAGLAHCLKLVHFHVGSQVPDIGTIKRAVREAARFYAKLSKMGHELGYLDVGGGLGVDYDGSRTTFDSSMNYSLDEYVRDIVYTVKEVCDSESVAHPTLVSESGRAIVAQHSVLIVETFGAIEKASRQETPTATFSLRKTALRTSTTHRKSASAPSQCSTSDSSTSAPKPESRPSIGRSPQISWSFSAMPNTSPRRSAKSKSPSATNTSATSPFSNPSSTTGLSANSSPSCRSID